MSAAEFAVSGFRNKRGAGRLRTLALAGTLYVELVAVMAKSSPFAQKAGMRRIAEQ